MAYKLSYGEVQSYVTCDSHYFMYFFGRSEYDSKKPVLTDSLKNAALPIVDKLNSGKITEEEAKPLLDKLYWH